MIEKKNYTIYLAIKGETEHVRTDIICAAGIKQLRAKIDRFEKHNVRYSVIKIVERGTSKIIDLSSKKEKKIKGKIEQVFLTDTEKEIL